MVEDLVFNRPIRISSDDRKFGGSFEIFAGRVSLPLFESNSGGRPIIKALFTDTTLNQLKIILNKILTDQAATPIELGLKPWNNETKQKEWKASIAVGRDTDMSIYFDMSGSDHKDPIRVFLVTDDGYTINGNDQSKAALTEAGARAIIDAIPRMLAAALAQARRKDGSFPPPITSSQSIPTPQTSTGTDIPFN